MLFMIGEEYTLYILHTNSARNWCDLSIEKAINAHVGARSAAQESSVNSVLNARNRSGATDRK